MGNLKDSLKGLSLKITSKKSKGNSVSEVLDDIASFYADKPIHSNSISDAVKAIENNYKSPEKPTQMKTVSPTTYAQYVSADEGYELSGVQVNAVNSSIDPDIAPNNIKQGVNILGVVGTYQGASGGIKTVKAIPTKKVKQWVAKTWTFPTGYDKYFSPAYIWTDGENVYHSRTATQLKLNKATSTWVRQTWKGVNQPDGSFVWTDGDNTYLENYSAHYVLNKATSTWVEKTWNGFTNFNVNNLWTIGDTIYLSGYSNQYVLDKATSTWVAVTWNAPTAFFQQISGSDIWSDGDTVYASHGSYQFVLDIETATWTEKTWNGLAQFNASAVWSDGDDIYCNKGSNFYVLDKSTSTWIAKTWEEVSPAGTSVWSDGDNIYYSKTYALQVQEHKLK